MAIRGKEQCKILIDNLPEGTTEKHVRDYFRYFGTIQAISIKTGFRDNAFRGFAFLVFNNSKPIEQIFAQSEHRIRGQKVKVRMTSEYTRNRKIVVRCLTTKISDQSIKDYFSKFGVIVGYSAPLYQDTKSRGSVCFISFSSKDSVENVLKNQSHKIQQITLKSQSVETNPKASSKADDIKLVGDLFD